MDDTLQEARRRQAAGQLDDARALLEAYLNDHKDDSAALALLDTVIREQVAIARTAEREWERREFGGLAFLRNVPFLGGWGIWGVLLFGLSIAVLLLAFIFLLKVLGAFGTCFVTELKRGS